MVKGDKMKTKIIALAFALAAAPVMAHEDHNHEASVEAAPHGGVLRDATPYKSELVLNKDMAKIYIYEKDLKPVTKDRMKPTIQGELSFPKDKKPKEVTLNYKGDAYEGTLKGVSKVHRYDFHVTVTVDGKPVNVDFGVDNIN